MAVFQCLSKIPILASLPAWREPRLPIRIITCLGEAILTKVNWLVT
jgi:hypothetical protein